MPMPRLVPRLTWTMIVLILVLFAVSIFSFSSLFFYVADHTAKEFFSYVSAKIGPVFAGTGYGSNPSKSLLNKAELARLIIYTIAQDNPFLPGEVNVSIRVHDKTGDVIYRIVRPQGRLRIAYEIIPRQSLDAQAFGGWMGRRFFWDRRSGPSVSYSAPLLSEGEPIGVITLISPLGSHQWATYITFILLLSLIYLLAFAGVAAGWFQKLKKNIDLLYLGLEENPNNLDTPPPAYAFEEFWQVVQWNKAVSAQIQESLQFQSTLFQNSPCGIFILDTEGKILEVNSRAWELLQRVKGAEEFGTICDVDMSLRIAVERAIEGKTDSGEITVPGQDQDLTLIFAVAPIQLATWQGAVMFWLDHTEVKRLDSHLRQTDRYQVIAELVSMTAHELRNPLTTIIANAQLGQIVRDEVKQQELFSRIQQASSRMNDFIKDLLSLCRPGEAQLSPMGLLPILNEVIGLVRAQLLTQGIEVELKYDEDTPQIWGEAKLLRQIFLNLIQNAIQAMPSGGRLIVKTKASANEAIVTIQDTGGGISPELQGKIFESFITNKEHGTGLGLFITRRIMVQNFGGRIWFSSTPGEGTEFYLAFPLAEPLSHLKAEKTEKRYWTGKQTMIQ